MSGLPVIQGIPMEGPAALERARASAADLVLLDAAVAGMHGGTGTAFDETRMRTQALPVLEAGGVDLVLGGHSHTYERTFLLNGHYGLSTTLTQAMILDNGNGRPAADGAYVKSEGSQPRRCLCRCGCVRRVQQRAGQPSSHGFRRADRRLCRAGRYGRPARFHLPQPNGGGAGYVHDHQDRPRTAPASNGHADGNDHPDGYRHADMDGNDHSFPHHYCHAHFQPDCNADGKRHRCRNADAHYNPVAHCCAQLAVFTADHAHNRCTGCRWQITPQANGATRRRISAQPRWRWHQLHVSHRHGSASAELSAGGTPGRRYSGTPNLPHAT